MFQEIEVSMARVGLLMQGSYFILDCDGTKVPNIGMTFKDVEAAKEFYECYAHTIGFSMNRKAYFHDGSKVPRAVVVPPPLPVAASAPGAPSGIVYEYCGYCFSVLQEEEGPDSPLISRLSSGPVGLSADFIHQAGAYQELKSYSIPRGLEDQGEVINEGNMQGMKEINDVACLRREYLVLLAKGVCKRTPEVKFILRKMHKGSEKPLTPDGLIKKINRGKDRIRDARSKVEDLGGIAVPMPALFEGNPQIGG
ncbi:hypothetical protein E2562_028934 [Oryza meyeriana var. granulata]|uniref:Uncharacterized protein n=1 Tax=Oryza meyeriana var. granulata TaxID=110450 RepID=A0A6G1FDC9_9ORYZ|nr:hypothetical protein E2562_028934 [Oryza meyeriana var. granulata]